jgi:hypothetical protein
MWVAVVCFLLLDKQPTPPRIFDGIRAGMLVSDAKLDSFQRDDAYHDAANRVRLVKDAGDGAKFYVLVAGDVVSRIGIEAPAKGLLGKLSKLWGSPSSTTNAASEAITSWTARGWHADLSCRGELCRMAFHEALTAGFFGGAVEPPGVLAALRPGMTRSEVAQLAPRYLEPEVPAGPEDVRITVNLAKSGHVEAIQLGGLPENARALLEKAWGASVETTELDGARVWFNPDRGWRAMLVENVGLLNFTGYVPASKILGAGKGIALFAKPLLGATREKISAMYRSLVRAEGKKLVIELPPSEGGVGRLVLAFDQAQRAKTMTLELPYDSDARRDELLKLMSAKWGTPKARAAALVFPAASGAEKLSIEVTDEAKRLDLTITLP